MPRTKFSTFSHALIMINYTSDSTVLAFRESTLPVCVRQLSNLQSSSLSSSKPFPVQCWEMLRRLIGLLVID